MLLVLAPGVYLSKSLAQSSGGAQRIPGGRPVRPPGTDCAPGEAPAYVYPQGAHDGATPVQVCLEELGVYDPATGLKTGSNYDPSSGGYVLNGRYVQTELVTLAPAVPRLSAATNSFLVEPTGTGPADARQNALWSAELHLYHYITDYRTNVANDAFIDSLGLPATIAQNLKFRQFRPDLSGLVNARLPHLVVSEDTTVPSWSASAAANDHTVSVKQRASELEPLDSLAFDPGYVIAQYTGVLAGWLTAGNAQWPSDPTWGEVGNFSWQSDIRPAVLEGFKLWNAYRYTHDTELFRYAMLSQRRVAGIGCGGQDQADCDQGWSLANVLTYLDTADPLTNNPVNPSWPPSASDDTLLFPFFVRGGANPGGFGPEGRELGGMFVAALFYDLSTEVGLGDQKADQLFWKAISLMDPGVAIGMTAFGQKVQQAARALWPDPSNPGFTYYEQDLVEVLASRGIRMNGATDFKTNLPLPLGVTGNQGPGTLTSTSSNGVGSSIPETQRNNLNGYNYLFYFANGYNVTTAGTQYTTYQFYKHSKYGPCDALDLTNGTINTAGTVADPIMNYDGSMAATYKGRSLGNMVLLTPGTTLNWLRRRQSCVSEEEGYYAEDYRSFGFRVVKAIPNGFTFSVTRGQQSGGRIPYTLTIVDPSLTLTGPNTGPATYNWRFTEYNGTIVNGSGQQVVYNALVNQPFTLYIERIRGAQNDNMTFRERGNDLDRNNGVQFNQDYWNTGYKVGFDTILDRRSVEGTGSYNSALNGAGAAFGTQAHRWTTPNKNVKPLSFATVSKGLPAPGNQTGAFLWDDLFMYYSACIWNSRSDVSNISGCIHDPNNGEFETQVSFSATGINLNDPFALSGGGQSAYLWTVNLPSSWVLQANTEYHFGSHINSNPSTNGGSFNMCSWSQARWDGLIAGNAADYSDWLAGGYWNGQNGNPIEQTMRDYWVNNAGTPNCTYAAYRFIGETIP